MEIDRIALLITCGTMDERDLQGDLIKIPKEQPPQEPLNSAGYARIFVWFSEAVLWAFPLSECQTWFVRGWPLGETLILVPLTFVQRTLSVTFWTSGRRRCSSSTMAGV